VGMRGHWTRTPFALVVAPLLLAGCAVPVAVSVASYAFDGFSYATEGKSVSDMAISQVAGQNCAMWRIVRGRAICRDYTPAEQRQIALARAEADNYDPRTNRMGEPVGYPVAKHSQAELVAQADAAQARAEDKLHAELAAKDLSGADRTTGFQPAAFTAVPQDELSSADKRVEAATDPMTPAERITYERMYPQPAPRPPVATQYASAEPWAPLPFGKSAVAGAGAGKASVVSVTKVVLPVRPVAQAKTPASATAVPAVDKGVYLVLASFVSRPNAEHALALYADARPRLVTAMVDGVPFHRVVSGPLAPEALAKARVHAARSYGIRNAWAMPACAGNETKGCVAFSPALQASGDTQLAALPQGD
jgi:hypothetical protein